MSTNKLFFSISSKTILSDKRWYLSRTTTTIGFTAGFPSYKGVGSFFSKLPNLTHLPFSAHYLSYPSPPRDFMWSSTFLYHSHHPPHTTCIASLSHHLSITHFPATSTYYQRLYITRLVTSRFNMGRHF